MYQKLISDLSWNFIGEVGAVLLLKCFKNNNILLELNIEGNSITLETSTMIGIILFICLVTKLVHILPNSYMIGHSSITIYKLIKNEINI